MLARNTVSQKITNVQTHSLQITKEMCMSLEILQMHSHELSDYLVQEAELNPFIDLENTNKEINEGPEEKLNSQEKLILSQTEEITLQQHLQGQINLLFQWQNENAVLGHAVTEYVDENGYITESIENIALEIGKSIKDIEAILPKLQTLEPTGVYARNLKECLKIQCAENGILDDIMMRILENLDLIAKSELKKLKAIIGTSEGDILNKIKLINKLNPKPGSNFSSNKVQTLIPDVIVIRDEISNSFSVVLNDKSLPSIEINREYINIIKQQDLSETEKEYCKNNIQRANAILLAVSNRNKALIKVTNAILEKQYAFFLEGPGYIKPMTLKSLAERLECHESTISRISNKTIRTEFGTFSIKYFLTPAIQSAISENVYSNKVIKHKIKALIDSEDQRAAVSDAKICTVLQSQGIKISRRTVTKYRESMKIPKSQHRKNILNLSA